MKQATIIGEADGMKARLSHAVFRVIEQNRFVEKNLLSFAIADAMLAFVLS